LAAASIALRAALFLCAEVGAGHAVLSPSLFSVAVFFLLPPLSLQSALDESDHFFHNQRTSVASLRRLTGIIAE